MGRGVVLLVLVLLCTGEVEGARAKAGLGADTRAGTREYLLDEAFTDLLLEGQKPPPPPEYPPSDHHLNPRNQSSTDWDHFGDHNFTPSEGYRNIGAMVFIFMTLISLEMFRGSFMNLWNMQECRDKTPPPKMFNFYSKTFVKEQTHVQWTDTQPVLVTTDGSNRDDNTTAKVYPYNEETMHMDGFIGLMCFDVDGVPYAKAYPIKTNDLMVTNNCGQFTEQDMDGMSWYSHTVGMQQYYEDLMDKDGLMLTRFFTLKDNEMYCPSSDQYLEILEVGKCSDKWPNNIDLDDPKGIKVWMEEWQSDGSYNNKVNNGSKYGARYDLGVEPERGARYMNKALALFYMVVLVFFSFTCSYTSLTAESGTTSIYGIGERFNDFLFAPAQPDVVQAQSIYKLYLKMFAGVVTMISIVLLRGIGEYIVINSLSHNPKGSSAKSSNVLYIGTLCKWLILLATLYMPPFLFYTARSVWSPQGRAIKYITAVVEWVNLELVLIFFANNIIALFNSRLGLHIDSIINPGSADLILGFTSVVTAVISMTHTVRDYHGMNDGCDLSDLGNTFRLLVRNDPSTFPVGSSQELYCTESNLTFAEVFNSSWDSLHDVPESNSLLWLNETLQGRTNTDHLDDQELQARKDLRSEVYRRESKKLRGLWKFDDGSVCTLVCAVPSHDGMPRVSSYPIWCKDNGFSGARWTLSMDRERLGPRLCPTPPNITINANTTTPTVRSAAQEANAAVILSLQQQQQQPPQQPPQPSQQGAAHLLPTASAGPGTPTTQDQVDHDYQEVLAKLKESETAQEQLHAELDASRAAQEVMAQSQRQMSAQLASLDKLVSEMRPRGQPGETGN